MTSSGAETPLLTGCCMAIRRHACVQRISYGSTVLYHCLNSRDSTACLPQLQSGEQSAWSDLTRNRLGYGAGQRPAQARMEGSRTARSARCLQTERVEGRPRDTERNRALAFQSPSAPHAYRGSSLQPFQALPPQHHYQDLPPWTLALALRSL